MLSYIRGMAHARLGTVFVAFYIILNLLSNSPNHDQNKTCFSLLKDAFGRKPSFGSTLTVNFTFEVSKCQIM